MNRLFNQLVGENPKHLWVQLFPENTEKAKQQSRNYSNEVARWNGYVNSICLDSLVEELQQVKEDLDLKEEICVWPSQEAMPAIWEVVNGSAIEIGDTRLVLIPSDSNDIANFYVPQEWVDVPGWAGHYYLAVQMHLEEDECWLRVWGFTNHKDLKEGGYNANEGSYSLAREDLIETLDVLWVSIEVCPEPQPAAAKVQSLAEEQAELLLAKLGRPTPYSPRLEVDFLKAWAPLMAKQEYRQELLNRRSQPMPQPETEPAFVPELVFTSSQPESETATKTPALSKWFNTVVDEVAEAIKAAGWLLPDEVFGKQLDYGWRSLPGKEKDLEKVVRRGKRFEFKKGKAVYPVGLVVNLVEETEENTIWILPQIRPIDYGGTNTYLPEGLELIVVNEAEEKFAIAKAEPESSFLQLNDWFGDSSGTNFSVRLALDGIEFTESFQI